MRLRLAVIGAGSWASTAHLPALAMRDEVEMYGVCRKGVAELEHLRETFGFQTSSEDPAEILSGGIDIAVVASPARFHHAHAKAALEAGAHVLCEKPMTIDPAEAQDLVETAARLGRELLVSFGWNYMPIVEDARSLLARNDMGALEHLSISMSSATREILTGSSSYPDADPVTQPDAATWSDPALSGGGYAQAQLSHALGLTFRLFPERVQEVFAMTGAPAAAPVELHDAIALRFGNGAVGAMAGGSVHRDGKGSRHALAVHAIGAEGQMLVDLGRDVVSIVQSDGTDVTLPLLDGAGTYDPFGPANGLVDVALGERDRNCAPGDLGLETVRVLAAVYRSAASGSVEAVA